MLGIKHGDGLSCPFCGRAVTAKSIGIARDCKSLLRHIPVVFLHVGEDGGTVYAQAYWTKKDFGGNYAGQPLYAVTRVYRLRRGEVLQWEGRGDENMHPIKDSFARQPFALDNNNHGYRVVGLEGLRTSFLRYTQYERWEQRGMRCGAFTSLIRYLALGALYPESVEMMMKTGLQAPITDYIYRKRKNSAVLRWGKQNPCRGFGLSKEDLRAFLATDKDMETLYVLRAFRRAGMRMGIAEACAAEKSLGSYKIKARKTAAICAGAGVRPDKLVRYLEQYTGGCHAGGYRGVREILHHWWDYIGSAKRLGYDLTVPGVLMPHNLEEAHDNAAALVRRQEEARIAKERTERDAELRERLRLERMKFDKRLKKLRLRYEYSAGAYLIRVAERAEEIIAEGKALSHCVAGYAERHMAGKVTILFLRRVDAPDTPLVTIEMDGKRLVQAHGYANEHKPCPENPEMERPEMRYAEILTPWLGWVKAGSRRDKAGNPIEIKEVQVA